MLFLCLISFAIKYWFIFLGGVGEAGNQGQNDADADWMDEINDEDDR